MKQFCAHKEPNSLVFQNFQTKMGILTSWIGWLVAFMMSVQRGCLKDKQVNVKPLFLKEMEHQKAK